MCSLDKTPVLCVFSKQAQTLHAGNKFPESLSDDGRDGDDDRDGLDVLNFLEFDWTIVCVLGLRVSAMMMIPIGFYVGAIKVVLPIF